MGQNVGKDSEEKQKNLWVYRQNRKDVRNLAGTFESGEIDLSSD